ncbi:TrkA family potassium uptake protein [Bacteroides ilei]|jgi:trk system potassium uptake protein TrkA|uniref:potassium channel family protein n=1 Tax=Bacteroides ilei TaxID=1907658 RepID=UPI000930A5A4|nr:TrkA family potassium uptake protein [Bacteroides ilei]
MKYIVIGLGNYGGVLAEELTALGHEVIGVDCNELHVDRLKDKIATAFVLDATDELSLSTLPLKKVDIVVVAIGENFGASVKVVSILKKNKVRHIYARAVDEIHKTVLEAFSLDRILTPEKEAARMLVQLLELNSEVEPFKIDEEYYVFKFAVPSRLCGMAVNDLQLEKNFNLKIISFIRGRRVENSLGISVLDRGVENSFEENYELQPEDELVCYGMYDDFLKFWKSVK